MQNFGNTDAMNAAKIVDLVVQEREKSLSAREWAHRLAGYGYLIKQTDHGNMIASLPRGEEICALPSHISV